MNKDEKEHIIDISFGMNLKEHWFSFGFKWACMQLLEGGFDEDCAEELNAVMYTMAYMREKRRFTKNKKTSEDVS